jgi:hypothetical protein
MRRRHDNPDIWTKPRVIPAINKLLTLESFARPDIVGGPIPIVGVTPTHIRWPQKGECQDQEQIRTLPMVSVLLTYLEKNNTSVSG